MKDYLATFVNTNGSAFPDTAGKNATSPGATDGTEWVKDFIDDMWGARQALMVHAGLTPDGNAEADGSSQFLEALRLKFGNDKIQAVGASAAANALTVTIETTALDFRSSTLGSGAINTRVVESQLSLVISSGSTLGTTNAIQSRIAILAIDNSGTLELAAVNVAGGNSLDETTLITTVAEGGAGAADSVNVIYSDTARASVPFRVVGFVESTQATAGTWATAPSTIQGYGGQAFAGMASIGYGQTWQTVTGSRAFNVVYTNTTGKPIEIAVYMQASAGSATFIVNGVSVAVVASNQFDTMVFIVPDRATYTVTAAGASLLSWVELR